MRNYFAIVEPDEAGGYWISFPGRHGITSAAESARDIIRNARDALESAAMHGGHLPRAIEDGANVPTNLAEYDNPMIVVVQFDPASVKAVA
jgi:predicted RNase H-like HicB family nuclease